MQATALSLAFPLSPLLGRVPCPSLPAWLAGIRCQPSSPGCLGTGGEDSGSTVAPWGRPQPYLGLYMQLLREVTMETVLLGRADLHSETFLVSGDTSSAPTGLLALRG